MTDQEKFSPPKYSSGDTGYLVVKALLSPIIGATELLERFISPPLQKRTEEWMRVVADTLRMLEKSKGIKIEELQKNEAFITVVIQASRVALGNHQKEKLVSLNNAIANSALIHEREDLQLIFIRYIDELTPSHLYLLRSFIKTEERLIKIKSYQGIFDLAREENLKDLSNDDLRLLLGDLSNRGLLRISNDIEEDVDIYHADSLLLESTDDSLSRIIVPEVARKFIKFISTIAHNH